MTVFPTTSSRWQYSDADAIVSRMAGDIRQARTINPADPVDLTDFGWTAAQVARHAPEARSLYEAEEAASKLGLLPGSQAYAAAVEGIVRVRRRHGHPCDDAATHAAHEVA